jgi:hypothetical protein
VSIRLYIYQCLEYKKLRGSSQNIISKLKKFYKELFNKPFPEKFDGLDIIKTFELAANKYRIIFIIYIHDENERLEYLNISLDIIFINIHNNNLLMINGVEENNFSNILIYIMYIKDILKCTKLYICFKCGYILFVICHSCY